MTITRRVTVLLSDAEADALLELVEHFTIIRADEPFPLPKRSQRAAIDRAEAQLNKALGRLADKRRRRA